MIKSENETKREREREREMKGGRGVRKTMTEKR